MFKSMQACLGDRAEGPLLRSRRAVERCRRGEGVESTAELIEVYHAELLRQRAGTVQTEQDRKLLFRRLRRRLGGVSEDALAIEFKKLLAAVGVKNGATLYTLRSSVTTAMHRARLPHLELRYLTGHSTKDILNTYVTLDPARAMQLYFTDHRLLLDAIQRRAAELGLCDG